jgi:hypothetical protein
VSSGPDAAPADGSPRARGTRVAVLQALLDRRRDPVYLEIGVGRGETLFALRAARRLGTDPALRGAARRWRWRPIHWANRGRWRGGRLGPCLFALPSDAFFARHGALLRRIGLDVAFVAGIRSYEQTLRDVEHCLDFLRHEGVVVLAGCNPPGPASASPSHAIPTPRDDGGCGDGYQTIVHLRTRRPDLETFVLDCEQGLGVVRRRTPALPLEEPAAVPPALDRAALASDRILDLRPPEAL